ncbi:MAG: hypothetical protein AB7F66_08920 [Bacteriovoracia bacterium]
MSLGNLINVFCILALAIGTPVAGYKAYKFVRQEVIKQTQKGLPSLEKFSNALTKPTK